MMEQTEPHRNSVELTREEQKLRKRKSGARILGFCGLVIVLVWSLVMSYQWRDTLTVKRLFVEGNRIVPAGEIVQRSSIKAGRLLYDIDLLDIQRQILKQQYIKSVVILRELPDGLRLKVVERQPLAAVSHGRTLFLDEDGVVLPPYEASTMFDVPFISGITAEHVTVGHTMEDANGLRGLALVKLARQIGPEVYHLISELRVEPNGDVILYSSDAGVTILVGKEEEERKLLLLKTFWETVVRQRGADQLHLVDLRYEDRIIARWKNAGNIPHQRIN